MLERYRVHGAAPAFHFLRACDRLRLPVAAFRDHFGLERKDQIEGCFLLEPRDQAYRFEGGDDGEAVLQLVHRPLVPLAEHPCRGVGVDGGDEACSERARLSEVGDMPAVQDVEHAVGEDERARKRGDAFAELAQRADFILE